MGMRIETFSDIELQKMRFVISRPDRLARYFEGNEQENAYYLQNTTKPPITFIKGMEPGELAFGILLRGYKKQALKMGVSEAFLKNQIMNVIVTAPLDVEGDDLFKPATRDELTDLAERIPYVTLLEAVSGWSKSKIKKVINSSTLRIDSALTTSKGRIAELVFKSLRGDQILKDMNEDDDPHSPYDFEDAELGRVDVKSSRTHKTKTQGKRWYFTLNSSDTDKVDNFVCIGMDETYEVAEFMKVVPIQDVQKPSFVISEGDINDQDRLHQPLR